MSSTRRAEDARPGRSRADGASGLTTSWTAIGVSATTARATPPRLPSRTATIPSTRAAHTETPAEREATSPLVPAPTADRRSAAARRASTRRSSAIASGAAPATMISGAPRSRSRAASASSPRPGASRASARRDTPPATIGATTAVTRRLTASTTPAAGTIQATKRDRAHGDDRRRCVREQDPEPQVRQPVHVADEPRQQVPGAQLCQPGRRQLREPRVDGPAQLAEDPERGVVGRQPLDVAEHAAADAERTHGGDRRQQRQHHRLLRRAADQPGRRGCEPDRRPTRRGARHDGEQEPPADRPPDAQDREDRAHATASVGAQPTSTVRSASATAPGRWATRRTAAPPRAASRTAASTTLSATSSRPAVGSSRSRIGAPTNERPGQTDAPALTAGQPASPLAEDPVRRQVAQPHAHEGRSDLLVGRGGRRQPHVLGHGTRRTGTGPGEPMPPVLARRRRQGPARRSRPRRQPARSPAPTTAPAAPGSPPAACSSRRQMDP